jgi:hypothetical protein
MTAWILAYPDQEDRRLKEMVNALPIGVKDKTQDGNPGSLLKQITSRLVPSKVNPDDRKLLDTAISKCLENVYPIERRQSSMTDALKPPRSRSMTPTISFPPIQSYERLRGQADSRPISPSQLNPPSEVLIIENLPSNAFEEELKSMFFEQPGYKRLGFYQGLSCLVYFEDVADAENALRELNSSIPVNHVKYGGVRISFAENVLSLRSAQRRGSSKNPA